MAFAIFVVFMLVVLLTFALVVRSHANGQGKSGAFWGTLVFCTGMLGLVAYAISLASD